MGAGANAGGFAAGFGRGLSQVLLSNRERSDRNAAEARNRKDNLFRTMLPVYLENVSDPSELEPFFKEHYPEVFGQSGKKGQAAFQQLAPYLSPLLKQAEAPAGLPAESSEGAPTSDLMPPPAMSAEGVAGPTGVPAPVVPQQKTLFGVPILSREQKVARDVDTDMAKTSAMMERVRTVILPQLKQMDPNATIQDAMAVAGIRVPSAMNTSPYQQVSGELADGTPVLGVFDETRGIYIHPQTREPIEGFRSRTSTGSTSLGQYAENAARTLGFSSASEAARSGKMAEVNELANTLREQAAGAGTTGRGQAAAKVPLTTAQRFDKTAELQTVWRKAEAPMREVDRQFKLMETGLERFKAGDKIGGSNAVIITFQKILDPASVVRESEYERIPQGMGLVQRLEGYLDRLQTGGAGVPVEEMEQIVETARQFRDGMVGWNDAERSRLEGLAKDFDLNPTRIFGSGQTAPRPETPAPGAKPAPATPGAKPANVTTKPNTAPGWTHRPDGSMVGPGGLVIPPG